ncbi:MAG: MarR family winged helix-turn-helix transcriptional regulator [Bilifractor sp.]
MKFTVSVSGISHSIQRIKDFALTPYGLKGRNVNCLFHLYRNRDGITLVNLAKACEEDKAAISRNVSDLRKMGYVTATSESGKNYRAKIRLTEAGLKAAEHLDRQITSAVENGGKSMTEEEREVFYRCLVRINSDLQEYCEQIEK